MKTFCKWCGKEFEKHSNAEKYCSNECQRACANRRKCERSSASLSRCTVCGRKVKKRKLTNSICTSCKKRDIQATGENTSICWDCTRQLDTCNWVINHMPIEDWVAQRNDVNGAESYIVKSCPNFMGKC